MSTSSHSRYASAPGTARPSMNLGAPGAEPWRATASCPPARMLIPKRLEAAIARPLTPVDRSEMSTVGGSAATDANAVAVIPHGRPSTRQVTSTTPLASALIASRNSGAGALAPAGSLTSFSSGTIRPSVGLHAHRDGHAVRDHVEDCRALRGALDDLVELLLRGVA